MLQSTYTRIFFNFIAGTLLPFAFAPHHLWLFAVLSPAVLLWTLLEARSSFLGFWYGFGFGLGFFGVGASWVFVSIHDYGNTSVLLAAFITVLFILVLSLFIGSQGYCLKRFFKGRKLSFCLLGFPSSWVLFEWIRGWAFTGFPWLYLGYAGLPTPLKSFAPYLSVFGVSTAFVLTSGLIVLFLQSKRIEKILPISLLVVLWVSAYFLPTEFSHSQRDMTASLIQGNVPPLEKFVQDDPLMATELLYGQLTNLHWESDLVLWPESAVSLPLPFSKDYLTDLHYRAQKHNSTLLVGTQMINNRGDYFNSLIALGNGTGYYQKVHLVPFGDFLPFEQWLRGVIGFFDLPMSSFKAGPKKQPLINTGTLLINPLICYEIAFPEQVRETLRHANVLVTLSEDGWFGHSWGPHQHLQIAQMRALETGRYVLRATTSGFTAIINDQGVITQQIPDHEALVLTGSFESRVGQTPWVRFGLIPLLVILCLSFLLPGRIPPKRVK